ncbi:MAG: peptidase S8 and S53, subtilisin, kexin, sedolisin [Ignavibacteriae bacterium]|nr:MAG: peptidase S8 and S53, subtilisin, kexin, sedolisin [Ignavibacteriota bacterium]
MKKIIYLSILLLLVNSLFSQDKEQREWLLKFANESEIIYKQQRAIAESIALKQGMPIRKEYPDGKIIELQRFENDIPIYYMTESNLNAARTVSTDKVWPGGSGGFSLTGVTDTLGIWDGGKVRGTHQELTGRVIFGDAASSFSDHSTHVAGTMIATGVSTNAKGMSYEARLRAYDWNNAESEMASAAANGLRVSNHSYGTITGWYWNYFGDNKWAWFGEPSVSELEDYKFGYYNSEAAQWDNIMRNAPYYLIVKSAGNDRGEGPSGSVEHWVRIGGSWTLVTSARDRDGGASGYDCISTKSGAKNILTVGAVNLIPSGYSVPGSVVMSSFSGWGPTDDGRIKPDVVGAGVNLYSCIATSDNAYDTYSGTSMSTPNISGSIGLILQHQKNLWENIPLRSSTVKGLVIHTADEAGQYTGPDYVYGWGLMNTLKAVQLMSTNKNSGNSFFIRELTLNQNDSILLSIPIKGNQPFKATICWTDPAGTPPPVSLDPPNLMLVNDLDMRLIRTDTIFYPWVLDPSNPGAAASTGDNYRDNVEQIYIQSPQKNLYTLKVKHKGNLTGGSQIFSLIISGAQNLVLAYPNGGENWHIGSTQTIRWHSSDFTGNVKIELSRNAGATYETLFESTPNDGSENWIVTGPISSTARIKITDLNLPNTNDFNSNFFTISQASLSLISPNGGEVFETDSIMTISWNSSNLPGKIKIELSRNDGSTYETIFDSTDNDGNENWIVTPPGTKNARVKISSIYIPTLQVISANNFTISAPFIMVSYPEDKTSMIIDSTIEIKWNSYRADDYVNIELSRDGGLTYETLFSSIPNDGSEFWTVTGPATDKAIMKISNSNPPELIGTTDGYFTIGNVYNFSFNPRWNLVSIPVKTSENRKSNLFPSASSNAFGYIPGTGYELKNELERMKGYWLKYPSEVEESFIGVLNLEDSLYLSKGWNLVGALSIPIDINSITTDPPSIIDGFIYGYSDKYSIADSIYPGKAYWVKVSENGMLYLQSTMKTSRPVASKIILDHFNCLKIVDKLGNEQVLYFTINDLKNKAFELPPLPPGDAFDIRFSTNKLVENFNFNTHSQKYIDIQAIEYPITLSWEIRDGSTYILNSKGNLNISLIGNGNYTINTISDNRLSMKLVSLQSNRIPLEYSLSQNYPNPFNPVTKITYSIPKDGKVILKVYNVIGNEVAELVNEFKEAGNYDISWDASSQPSGVYFYKLQAGNFTSVKKMLLMR